MEPIRSLHAFKAHGYHNLSIWMTKLDGFPSVKPLSLIYNLHCLNNKGLLVIKFFFPFFEYFNVHLQLSSFHAMLMQKSTTLITFAVRRTNKQLLILSSLLRTSSLIASAKHVRPFGLHVTWTIYNKWCEWFQTTVLGYVFFFQIALVSQASTAIKMTLTKKEVFNC